MGNSVKAFCAHHLEDKEEELATEVALPRAQDYTASVKVDAPLLRFIIGKGGETKVKIEKDTATQLIVPSPHQARNGSCLVVKGPSQEKVDEAIGHIQYVLQEATEYSHFISLPLAMHPALIKKAGMFHDSVMALATALDNNDTDHGIEESIFINPATLHLTVLMLKLWNKERIAAAVDVLQSMKSRLMEALDNRPVAVRLRGLECMTGSPAKAHVLYARVKDADQQNRLLNTCKVIRDAFMEAGLVSDKDKKKELKLHATLINTQRRRKRGKQFGKRLPFDARSILAKHKDDDWGKHTIMEVHLSQRFVFDENGYYHCCSSIQLPSA